LFLPPSFLLGRILSSGDNKVLREWGGQSGKDRRQVAGHTGLIFSGSANGRRILSGGKDGSMRL
jgi:hypothetical protein